MPEGKRGPAEMEVASTSSVLLAVSEDFSARRHVGSRYFRSSSESEEGQ